MITKFLFDADTYAYKIAYWNEEEDKELVVRRNTINFINNLIRKHTNLPKIDSENYILLLSSKYNFRNQISPNYKANRKIQKKLLWLEYVYNIIKKYYNYIEVDGFEADDLAATLMKMDKFKFILVHDDKDLLQIPGEHIYRNKYVKIDEITAYKFMFFQILVGDSTDNIKGVQGIGKVKAKKIIKRFDIIDLMDYVIKLFKQQYGNEMGLIEFYKTYRLIKLRTDVPIE